MKRTLFVLLAVLLCITAFSSCSNDEQFYLKSSKAGSWGENTHMVDVSSTQSKYDISDSRTITFSVGLGGSGNFANRVWSAIREDERFKAAVSTMMIYV